MGLPKLARQAQEAARNAAGTVVDAAEGGAARQVVRGANALKDQPANLWQRLRDYVGSELRAPGAEQQRMQELLDLYDYREQLAQQFRERAEVAAKPVGKDKNGQPIYGPTETYSESLDATGEAPSELQALRQELDEIDAQLALPENRQALDRAATAHFEQKIGVPRDQWGDREYNAFSAEYPELALDKAADVSDVSTVRNNLESLEDQASGTLRRNPVPAGTPFVGPRSRHVYEQNLGGVIAQNKRAREGLADRIEQLIDSNVSLKMGGGQPGEMPSQSYASLEGLFRDGEVVSPELQRLLYLPRRSMNPAEPMQIRPQAREALRILAARHGIKPEDFFGNIQNAVGFGAGFDPAYDIASAIAARKMQGAQPAPLPDTSGLPDVSSGPLPGTPPAQPQLPTVNALSPQEIARLPGHVGQPDVPLRLIEEGVEQDVPRFVMGRTGKPVLDASGRPIRATEKDPTVLRGMVENQTGTGWKDWMWRHARQFINLMHTGAPASAGTERVKRLLAQRPTVGPDGQPSWENVNYPKFTLEKKRPDSSSAEDRITIVQLPDGRYQLASIDDTAPAQIVSPETIRTYMARGYSLPEGQMLTQDGPNGTRVPIEAPEVPTAERAAELLRNFALEPDNASGATLAVEAMEALRRLDSPDEMRRALAMAVDARGPVNRTDYQGNTYTINDVRTDDDAVLEGMDLLERAKDRVTNGGVPLSPVEKRQPVAEWKADVPKTADETPGATKADQAVGPAGTPAQERLAKARESVRNMAQPAAESTVTAGLNRAADAMPQYQPTEAEIPTGPRVPQEAFAFNTAPGSWAESVRPGPEIRGPGVPVGPSYYGEYGERTADGSPMGGQSQAAPNANAGTPAPDTRTRTERLKQLVGWLPSGRKSRAARRADAQSALDSAAQYIAENAKDVDAFLRSFEGGPEILRRADALSQDDAVFLFGRAADRIGDPVWRGEVDALVAQGATRDKAEMAVYSMRREQLLQKAVDEGFVPARSDDPHEQLINDTEALLGYDRTRAQQSAKEYAEYLQLFDEAVRAENTLADPGDATDGRMRRDMAGEEALNTNTRESALPLDDQRTLQEQATAEDAARQELQMKNAVRGIRSERAAAVSLEDLRSLHDAAFPVVKDSDGNVLQPKTDAPLAFGRKDNRKNDVRPSGVAVDKAADQLDDLKGRLQDIEGQMAERVGLLPEIPENGGLGIAVMPGADFRKWLSDSVAKYGEDPLAQSSLEEIADLHNQRQEVLANIEQVGTGFSEPTWSSMETESAGGAQQRLVEAAMGMNSGRIADNADPDADAVRARGGSNPLRRKSGSERFDALQQLLTPPGLSMNAMTYVDSLVDAARNSGRDITAEDIIEAVFNANPIIAGGDPSGLARSGSSAASGFSREAVRQAAESAVRDMRGAMDATTAAPKPAVAVAPVKPSFGDRMRGMIGQLFPQRTTPAAAADPGMFVDQFYKQADDMVAHAQQGPAQAAQAFAALQKLQGELPANNPLLDVTDVREHIRQRLADVRQMVPEAQQYAIPEEGWQLPQRKGAGLESRQAGNNEAAANPFYNNTDASLPIDRDAVQRELDEIMAARQADIDYRNQKQEEGLYDQADPSQKDPATANSATDNDQQARRIEQLRRMLELSGQNYNSTHSLFVPQQHLAEVQRYISGDVFPEDIGKPFTTGPVAIGAEDVGWETLTPQERIQIMDMEGVSPEQAVNGWRPTARYQRVSFRHQFKVNNVGGRPSNPAAATRTIILPANGSMAFSPDHHVLDVTDDGPVLHAPRQATDAELDAATADDMNIAADRAASRGVPDAKPNPARAEEGPSRDVSYDYDGTTRNGPLEGDGSEPAPIDIEAGLREELGPDEIPPAARQPAARPKAAPASGGRLRQVVETVQRNKGRTALGVAVAGGLAGTASYMASRPEEAEAAPVSQFYPPDAGGDGADINSGRPDVLARIRGSRPVGIMTAQYGIPY